MILVTGCAGFIGFHTCLNLLKRRKDKVIGIDNLNDYYDVNLKKERLKILKKNKKFFFKKLDLGKKKEILNFIKKKNIKYVIHLAAQAGIRYSLKNPKKYFDSNILGFFNLLESLKNKKIEHLVFASSSSVYGNKKKFPILETDTTDKPIQFYASTKKTNEIMAHTFSSLTKIPATGLRFFTVYGPWGRPDMAFFKFVENIKKNKKIEIYNKGNHERDFSYIDYIAEGIVNSLENSNSIHLHEMGQVPFEIYNLGNGKPVNLMKCVKIIENIMKKKAKKKFLKIQSGDVIKTYADIKKAKKDLKLKTNFSIFRGLKNFIEWHGRNYK